MTSKFSISIIIIFLITIACTKHDKKTESAEINIETKIIKEDTTNEDNIMFHIDAQIPTIEGIEFGFEELIKKWKNDTIELFKTIKEKKEPHESFYYSDFEIFKNLNLNITSILYNQFQIDKYAANGLTTYHSINLRGKEKIELADIISKDQLDSLIQVLREEVKTKFEKIATHYDNKSTFEIEFEKIFKQYQYYFKNNEVVIFYNPLIIGPHSDEKIEFTFPINNNSEGDITKKKKTDCPICS
ncbi:RsiV family protein [Borrelia recurrentis]|uniref:Lipoprotein n=1 Tax=Borrelia recurrentis (strain A1) TaxID=412418 RepID=B5RRR3_BORRA|nr:RsiV family protein [Borrelia recurrentis]ACH94697.1 putative lipoprotein [Borrelia recurrentis A1]